nr:hypothetical protein [Tanacetum cinerariifolium]
SDSDQEINANMVFMAQIEKVLSDSETNSSSADDKISEVSYYLSESESEYEYETSEYYDNTTTYDQLQVKHVVIDTHVECQEKYAKLEAERYEYMIRYSAYFDNDEQHRKQIADQEVLYDKTSVQLVELDKHVRDLKKTILEKDFKISELEECVRNKDLEIEKCLERLNVCENKLHKIDFDKIDSSFQQTSSLKPYVSTVILKKIIIDLEDEVVSLLEKQKAKLEIIESLK